MLEGNIGVSEELFVEMVDAVVTIPAAEFDKRIQEFRVVVTDIVAELGCAGPDVSPVQTAAALNSVIDALVASAKR